MTIGDGASFFAFQVRRHLRTRRTSHRPLLSLAGSLAALLCATTCLIAPPPAAAQGVLTGRVAARGQVLRDENGKLDPAGKPSWVEYLNNEQRPLSGSYARDPNAVAMSAADYNRLANQVVVIPTDFPSVLVNITTKELLYKSRGVIGRETAFMYGGTDPGSAQGLSAGCKSAPGSDWGAASANFSNCPPGAMIDNSKLMVWAPVVGAELEMISYGVFNLASSQPTGWYTLPYQTQLDEDFVFDVNATLAYANFNPRVPSSRQFILTRKNNISDLTRSLQVGSYSIPYSRQSQFTNFPVEIAMVRIDANLVNTGASFADPHPGIKIVGLGAPPAEAHKASNLTQYVVHPTDEDQGLVQQISASDLLDSELYVFAAADDRMIGSRWGLYPSELNTQPASDDPNTPEDESASLSASFTMVTLIRGPTAMSRGLYIPEYNPATRIADVRAGLELDYNPDPSQSGAPLLREGDAIKIIVINRATGYTGVARGRVHTGPSGITEIVGMDGGPLKLDLRPPRLRIKVQRQFTVKHGATTGEERKYIVGFEGSGLNTDTVIDIHTEWVGIAPDGSDVILPETLPGFTGRLAYVDEAQDGSTAPPGGAGSGGAGGAPLVELKPAGCTGDTCVQDRTGLFQIGGKPSTVVAVLPEGRDRGHLYVHIDAQPLSRNVDFSGRTSSGKPDFSINEACRCADPEGCAPASNGWECGATAVLRPRPMSFVPFLVPFQGAPEPGEAPDPPTWKYRPEMQFSLLEFDPHHLTVKTDAGQTRDILNTSSTLQSGDDKVQLIYDLLRDPVAELPRFGDERKLAFTLGNQRHDATLAALDTEHGNVIDFKSIGALKGASPADFLTIRLVQDGNEANVLWEYRFNDAKIVLEDGKGSIAPGDSGKAIVVAEPHWPGAVWSHVESDDGVDATIDASTGVIKASEESKEGFFTIRAVRQDNPTEVATARIPIGCECLTCKTEGTCKTETSSIHAEFALGQSPGGGGGGLIVLHDEALSDLIYTPRLLKVDTLSTSTEALYDGNGLRQVTTPNVFVDIRVPDPVSGQPPPESYEMVFYPRSARGAFSDGLYEVKPSAMPNPTAKWRIYNPTPGVYSALRIVGQLQNRAEPDAREFRVQNGIVTLLEGTMEGDVFKPLRTEEQQETVVDDLRRVRETVRDNAGNIASVVESSYETLDGKPMLVAEVIDPDGAALTTTHTYHRTVDPGAGAYSGQRESTQRPDGSWTKWLYDEHGRVISEQHTWLDSPFTSPSSQVRVVEYSYNDPAVTAPSGAIHFGEQPPDEDFHRPRVTTERITGIVVSKTFLSIERHADTSRVETEERCPKQNCSFGANDNLRAVRRYYPKDPTDPQGNDSGMLKSVQHPDGRLDSYSYERGTVENGSFRADATGNALRTTITHGTVSHPGGIAYRSTEDVSTTDDIGQSILDETHVYTGAGHELLTSTARTYDSSGRLLRTENSNGEVTTTEWGCCSENGSTDSRGITTTVLSRDALNRVTAEQRAGITTTRTYDAAGRELTVTRSGGGLQLSSSRRYDNAGRLTESRDEQGLLTTYSYDPSGRRTTVTRPGGFTEVSDQYADGKPRSTSGTATVAQYLSHRVDPDGSRVAETRTARPDSPAFERAVSDLLGRTIRTERPAFGGGLEITASYFNAKGQLARASTTGMADTLYEYDELGDETRSALDVDDNGSVDLASNDRVQESDTHFTSIDGAWWQESISRIYPETDSATAVITGSTRSRISAGNSLSEQVAVDIHGNETRSTVTVNRAQRTETRRTDVPDSVVDAVAISVDGRVASSMTTTGVTTAYDYDGLGRRVGIASPRTGRTVTTYDPTTGRITATIDPATHSTTYSYDANTGRKTRECNALGKCSYFAYSDRGELIRTWGEVPYPVEYVYDDYGRRTEMRTFRVDLGWTGPAWPTADGHGDTTTWVYDEPTGLLLAKRDAADKAVTYSYGPAGRLATRTWARPKPGGGPLTTTYGYSPDTGELVSVNYNDTTPDVAYLYDRLGRQVALTDGTGSRTFAYDPATLVPTQESISGIAPAFLSRRYDLTGVKGRPTGIGLGDDYAVAYSYDAAGRMQNVNWTIAGHSDSATYSYLPSSELLAGLTTTSGQATTYQYEPSRDLKTQVANRFGGALVSQYDYAYDAVGRRTSVKNSGSAFGQPAFSRWGYDDRNQLTGSDRFLGAVLTDTGTPVNPEARAYEYDGIGNRESSTSAGALTAYVANALNQYEAVGAASPEYDADGNLLADESKTLKYNAENQLIEVLVPGVSRSTFSYDYIGRRVKKTVDVLDESGPDYWAAWVYNGWNKVQETKTVGSTTTTKNFVWGLDLSQSMEGAGGIGGLLAVVDEAGNKHLFSYDGNGNVGQLTNSTTGVSDAQYEYDAYGNLIAAVGPQAQENAYRFSTKYADDETGLVYYGYRYYEPGFGRWINRDPIGEVGGSNLYEFAVNRPVDAIDSHGKDATVAQHLVSSERLIQRRVHVGLLVVPGDCNRAEGEASNLAEANVAAREIAANLRRAYPPFSIAEGGSRISYEFFFDVKSTTNPTPVYQTSTLMDAAPGKGRRSVISAYREARGMGLENVVVLYNRRSGNAFAGRVERSSGTQNVVIVQRTQERSSIGSTVAHEVVHLLGLGHPGTHTPGGLMEISDPSKAMSRVANSEEQGFIHGSIHGRPEGITFPDEWMTGGTDTPFAPVAAP
jgi:RHS repeat-associated protein